jgi:hypothetical protein
MGPEALAFGSFDGDPSSSCWAFSALSIVGAR